MISRRQFVSNGILALMAISLGIKLEQKKKPVYGWMEHGFAVLDNYEILKGVF